MATVLHNLDNSNRGGIQELILRLHRYSAHTHHFWASHGTMARQMADEGLILYDSEPPSTARYDVVVGHTVGGWSCDNLSDWAHNRGARFVECLHSIHPSPTNPAKVDAFVALSQLALSANPAMHYYKGTPHAAQAIYAPINAALYDHPRDELPQYIGRLSRLVAEKRPVEFSRLAPFFPSERFLIAGEGAERSRINSYPNLFFTGWLTEPHRFYSKLKFFVFPTQDECCCVSVAQAQMAGVPVICQDIPALQETTGGHAIFASGHGEFVSALTYYLQPSHYAEALTMAESAKRWARNRFDLPVTVGKWDQLIGGLSHG